LHVAFLGSFSYICPMFLMLDLDISLFCTRYKLEREMLAYYLLREAGKGVSGYVNKKAAVSMLIEKTGCSYATAMRRLSSLKEMGFVLGAGKGNIHINGLYRVKTMLSDKFGDSMSFVRRRRCFEADLGKGTIDLNALKAQTFSALTADKLARNKQKFQKDNKRSNARLGKAAIGMALAKDRYLESYAISLQQVDFNIAAGTASKRSKLAQKLGYQKNEKRAVPGMSFATRNEAIWAGLDMQLPNFGRLRLIRTPEGAWSLRDADRIVPAIQLLRRSKDGRAMDKGAELTVSGQAKTASYLKDRSLIFNKLQNRNLFFATPSDQMGRDSDPFLSICLSC